MKLIKVNIGANKYVHKFRLEDKTVITEATTKASYDNLKDQIKPTKPDATWFMSSIRIGFDTPSGNLSDGEYATQKNGYHWVKLAGYEMWKVMPEDVHNDNLLKGAEKKIEEYAGPE